MGVDSLIELINEIEASLEAGFLKCALGMALTLPDICGAIEYKKENSNRKRYESWCENFMYERNTIEVSISPQEPDSTINEEPKVIDPNVCYKLRCSYLHSGNLNINEKRKGCTKYPTFNLHMTHSNDQGHYCDHISINTDTNKTESISVDVYRLCHVLCNSAKEYYRIHEPKLDFVEHRFNIIDVKQEVDTINKIKERTNFNCLSSELSAKAKEIYTEFLKYDNFTKKTMEKFNDNDIETSTAIFELFEKGFITMNLNNQLSE